MPCPHFYYNEFECPWCRFNMETVEAERFVIETPAGGGEVRWDQLHEHHSPEAHSGQFGANVRFLPDDGSKPVKIGTFELDIIPKPKG